MHYALVLLFAALVNQAQAACIIKTPNELLNSIKVNHPLLNESKLANKALEVTLDEAKQRPNPELDIDAISSRESSENILNTTISLKHRFELGGKRNSRIRTAKSKIALVKSQYESEDQNVIIDSVIRIYRLSQIKTLIPVYEEAQEVFREIMGLYESRKSLSPQEEVEKETINLVLSDYSLNLTKLASEKSKLLKHIRFFAGNNCKISEQALEVSIRLHKNYKFKSKLNSYSKLKVAKLNLELAKSRLESAKSNKYPDLEIGPKLGFSRVGDRNNNSIGFALTMDLPVFNQNKARVLRRTKEITVANAQFKSVRSESEIDYKEWKKEFLRYQKSLREIASYEDLEKKHRKVEKLFKRGIISTTFVIESHRQMIQFTNTRNDFEIGYVKSFWNLLKLQGKLESYKL